MTARHAESLTAGGIQVDLSHTGKVLFPGDDEITKGDLIEYYAEVAARMLPYLRERPIAMARYPDGIARRHEVERMVRQVRGVVGVTDSIMVKTAVSPAAVQAEIEESFKREAEVDARHIRVEVSDHTAKLYGHVHSLHEASAARTAAASAPGVAAVEDHLVVSP